MMIVAKTISFLSHPFFVLFYGSYAPYVLIEKFGGPSVESLKWIMVSYFFLGLNVAFVLISVLFGVFSDFDITKKEQRPVSFLFATLLIVLYVLSLFIFDGPKVLFIAVFAAVLGLVIISIINKWIKTSMHVATISSIIFLIGLIYKGPYLLLLFLIPVIGWSRVKTKKHTPLEATIGGILGGALTIFIYIASRHFLI